MSYLFDCYSGVYDKFMKTCHIEDTTVIEDYLNDKHFSILDVGGGTGTLANRLQNNGHHVTIIDASKAMLKEAEKKNNKFTLIHSSLKENLDIREKDIIYSQSSFHNVKKTAKHLSVYKFVTIHECQCRGHFLFLDHSLGSIDCI